MVSLKEKLLDDLKTAMKNKDSIRKNTVQLVRSAVLQFEKDNKATLDDDGVIDIIAKELKKWRDSLPDFIKSGRQDLIEELERKISILLEYLPQQLTEEQLNAIVSEVVAGMQPLTEKDIGKVMQAVMPKVKGKADGKQVNSVVRKFLVPVK